MQLRSPRARTRLVDPGVPAPGSVALTYGDGLILDATPPPKLQVDFGTGHDQVARGDAAPDAAAVSVDSSSFTGPASGTTTVQAALAALDAGGGGGSDAAAVSVDSSSFTGPASGTTTVQAALAALDAGGGGGSDAETFTFDTADGLTLAPDPSPGGAGETAAVTGGALVLTIPAGVRRDYSAGSQQSPHATVSLLSEGCAPLALRAQARVAFSATGSRVGCWAHFVLRAASGERVQLQVTWKSSWLGQATVLTFDANGTAPTIVGAFPGTTDLDPELHDGRLYLRLVVFGRWVVGYYGLGTLGPVAPPSTWVELGRVGLTTAAGVPLRWTDLRLVGSHESAADNGAITITWDDLTITRG